MLQGSLRWLAPWTIVACTAAVAIERHPVK